MFHTQAESQKKSPKSQFKSKFYKKWESTETQTINPRTLIKHQPTINYVPRNTVQPGRSKRIEDQRTKLASSPPRSTTRTAARENHWQTLCHEGTKNKAWQTNPWISITIEHNKETVKHKHTITSKPTYPNPIPQRASTKYGETNKNK